MKTFSFVKKTTLKAPLKRVFQWHLNEGSIERFTPPFIIRFLGLQKTENDQATLVFSLHWGLFKLKCQYIQSIDKTNKCLVYTQKKGIFSFCQYKSSFHIIDDSTTLVEDKIEYALPFEKWIAPIFQPFIQKKLKKIFNYRHNVIKKDLEKFYQPYPGSKPLKVLIAGASGFLGKSLRIFFSAHGHLVKELSHKPRCGAFYWDPQKGILNKEILEDLDVIINFAGSPIVNYWNKSNKKLIHDSRILSTQLLAESIALLEKPPRVFMNASGINIYGYNRNEALDEQSQLGNKGYLTEVCKKWEKATELIAKSGSRVAQLRLGVVLSPKGGVLLKIYPFFKLGLGCIFGNGRQKISWVTLDDLLDSVYFTILNPKLQGPINFTTPYFTTDAKFKKTLGKKLKRPVCLKLPASILNFFLQDMSKELLLSSLKVNPSKLLDAGYIFRYKKIEHALKNILF